MNEFDLICEEFDEGIELSDGILIEAFNELDETTDYATSAREMYEAGKSFGASIAAGFGKIVETIRALIEKLVSSVRSKIKQMQIKKKISDLEANYKLAAGKKVKGKKGKYASSEACVKYYKAFANDYVKLITTMANRKFASAEAAEKAFNGAMNKLEQKYSDMYNEEGLKISIASGQVKEALSLSKKEFAQYEKNMQMIESIATQSVRNCEKVASKDGDPRIVAFAKRAGNKISSGAKKVGSTVSKHPFKTIAVVIAAVGVAGAGTVGVKAVNARSKGRDAYNYYAQTGGDIKTGKPATSHSNKLNDLYLNQFSKGIDKERRVHANKESKGKNYGLRRGVKNALNSYEKSIRNDKSIKGRWNEINKANKIAKKERNAANKNK